MDGSVIVEHALVGSGHGHGSAGGGVRQSILVDVRGVDGGGPKLRGSSDAAGGGSDARGELRKVVNRLKHDSLLYVCVCLCVCVCVCACLCVCVSLQANVEGGFFLIRSESSTLTRKIRLGANTTR